ncbi:Pyrimidine-specific ribonucleoside hydrolase RihA [Corynebacterium heidelbergense]|uniref:nucleoside hydrolase n=1 Tax=Corynebacterium heidelbergense TaxID=2055947 RepID=UPI002358B7EB|nr:nucleoside hydrolase [Corynebacterium heidelbergense]WCZ37595.1 Pyrimidine-specific ribonucleoside hydrolase RihA [Corynebacterium heidelbergense]
MEKHKIILDCDPGHDDAVAMLLAWGNPGIELLGVTTVAGNQTLEKVTHNARAVARVGNMRGIPIAAGAHRPLIGPQVIPAEIHGDSGMDGPQLPQPDPTDQRLDPRHAVTLMADLVLAEEPNTVTIVATGAQTNLALFARMYPELVERVRGITFMGGGHHTGNMTPAAEFNILADPEAAAVVLEERWPVTMVGLDVTHKVLAVPERMAQLHAVGTDVATFIAELVEFFGAAYRRERRYPGPPLHDPLAVAAIADPGVLRTIAAPIAVETTGRHTRGQTVVDLRNTWGAQAGGADPSALGLADSTGQPGEDTPGYGTGGAHHRVAVDVDTDRFFHLLTHALGRIGNTNFREPRP